MDFLDPTALQGFQVPVGGWAQQVQILHVYFEILQLLLQLGSVLRGMREDSVRACVVAQPGPQSCSPGVGVTRPSGLSPWLPRAPILDISSPRQFPRRPLLLTCLHSNPPPPRPSSAHTYLASGQHADFPRPPL